MSMERIPTKPYEFAPDQVYGMFPDGEDQVMNEYLYPDYPDLPSPEPENRWEHNNDPLLHDEESGLRQEAWSPEDPLSPWREPYTSQV